MLYKRYNDRKSSKSVILVYEFGIFAGADYIKILMLSNETAIYQINWNKNRRHLSAFYFYGNYLTAGGNRNMNFEISLGLIIQIGVYLVTIGCMWGTFSSKLKSIEDDIREIKTIEIKRVEENIKEDMVRIEKKQDKNNSLVERMVMVEQSIKSAHKRIDDIGV